MKPPKAPERPHLVTFHGHERNDPYAWLRDENWQKLMQQPEVLRKDIRKHLEAENAYADSVMKDAKVPMQVLIQEMIGRIKREDSSVPSPAGEYSYYARYEASSQHPIHCRTRRLGAPRAGGAAAAVRGERRHRAAGRGGVVDVVGLGLDDLSGRRPLRRAVDEHLTEQGFRHRERRAGVERR